MINLRAPFKFILILLFFSDVAITEEIKKILFVGNSYLYYNDSVHNYTERLLIEYYEDEEIVTKSATIGGSKLRNHNIDHLLNYKNLQLDEQIDLLIMQGGSYEVISEKSRAKFAETATEYSTKAQRLGIKTALYMTHAYLKNYRRYETNLI